jgi:hypothetical protein
MQYYFYVMTTEGLMNGIVDSDSDFTLAPFGFAPYRDTSSECDSATLDDFWRCVDMILTINNLTSEHYVRAIRAYSDGKLYGEYDK